MTAESRSSIRKRRVLLAFTHRIANLNIITGGILDYARKHANWTFVNGGALFDFPLSHLGNWQPDGIIAMVLTPAHAKAARRLKVPAVTFSGVLRQVSIPRVMVDQAAIGGLAAQHLLARGYPNFGFYGVAGAAYSEDRQQTFDRLIAARGFALHSRLTTLNVDGHRKSWSDELDELSKWLGTLPTPIGLYAADDQRARILADACDRAGKRIPTDIGIIGTDNDELPCEIGTPTLTSIARPWHAIGYEAAALLDRLMNGAARPAKDKLIPPAGIIARESTNAMITDNPHVARAIEFANQRYSEQFGVERLVDAAGISRRRLEIAFRKALGCSPMQYLARFRIECAKVMLQSKGLSLSRIARQCGFTDLRHFRHTFVRLARMTPRQYRVSIKFAQKP